MMEPNIKTELLTLREASGWLKVKVPTLRKWGYQRKMPLVRIGRGIRIPTAWVLEQIRVGYQPAIQSGEEEGHYGN